MPVSKASQQSRLRRNVLLMLVAAITVGSIPVLADEPLTAASIPQLGRLGLIEENDGITGHQDRHYTQGLLIPYLLPSLPAGGFWDRSFDFIGRALPMYRAAPDAQRRFEWQVIGQSQFTPTNIHLTPPDPHDRPYAAWLYTGFDWLQQNDGHSLHNLEVQLGVVGPAALGEELQNGYHALAGFHKADGWRYQIANRPALQFSYEYKRRFELDLGRGYGFDVIPEAGLSLGTVLRYAEASALLRFGNSLRADYGPERIRPALSGTAFFDANALGPSRFHFDLFFGVQGRRVFYNRFIDGEDELNPPGIGRKQEVADVVTGTSMLFGRRFRADFTATFRTPEYTAQKSRDVFGAATLAYSF